MFPKSSKRFLILSHIRPFKTIDFIDIWNILVYNVFNIRSLKNNL